MIIETDIGHDPDDFFAICYLVAAGVKVEAICVTPGDLDQIAICKLLCDELGLNIPIGVSKTSEKYSSGSIHHALLKKYNRPLSAKADGLGCEILKSTVSPESEIFIIGPPSSVGKFFSENKVNVKKLVMQGGFLGYHLHDYQGIRLDKFEGKTAVPTFNMNGDRKGTLAILDAKIGDRRFCGKNVCHTVICTSNIIDKMHKPQNRAGELFCEGLSFLFNKHADKKFHDPVAAVCSLHPEVGKWIKSKVQKLDDGWGTLLDGDCDTVLADLDRKAFWEHIYTLV